MIGAQIPVTGQVDLLEMQPSYGDFIGASLEMGWMRNPVPSWLRYMDREEARGKDTLDYMHDPGIQSLYRTLGLTGKRDPNDLSPMVPKSQLNEIYGRIGLNFKNDERVEVAAMIATQKERENRLQELQKRAESRRTYGTGFLAEMAAGIADPLNIASAFIPVVGQARYASMLARYGATTARAARGLVEGAVGAALVEPLVLLGATDEQADYTAMDSLLNVAFGGVLGGGLHTGLGAIKDFRAARTGRLSEAQTAQVLDFVERETAKRTATPQNEVAQQFDVMPVADKENIMRATVAQMEEGKTVNTGELHEAIKEPPKTEAGPQVLTRETSPEPAKLMQDVKSALDAGKQVTLKTADATREIAAVNKDGAVDTKGARIDHEPFFKGEAQVEIREPKAQPEAKQQTPKERLQKFTEHQSRPESVRTADVEAAKDASAKLETTKAPTDAEREIADLESEIADITTRTKPLQENLGIKDDLLKEADDAIKQAKSEAQAYQIAAACKLGL